MAYQPIEYTDRETIKLLLLLCGKPGIDPDTIRVVSLVRLKEGTAVTFDLMGNVAFMGFSLTEKQLITQRQSKEIINNI